MVFDPQTSRFWQDALRSGLMDEAGLQACWESIPESKRTADAIDRRLARQAVASGRLSLWQAQQVLNGRGQALRIDKYILRDVLGQGGMGRVYLARDTRLHRMVAVKILSRERMTSPRALARFEREAKVGAQLQHDNLVRIYDEGECRGLRYLVMEYIEGKNVAQLLAESGRLSPVVAAKIGRQVAMGLEHARLKGLIHRDVNPQNILVTRDGTAKLTDMGLAIDLGDAADIVTRDGATVGTFDYISPEQARHPRSVDTRSDIYSLGCALYHMLAGRAPFLTASLPEKLYAHQLNEPEPLKTLVPDLPAGLDDIIHKMMAKNPNDRFPNPLAVAQALEPFAEGAASFSGIDSSPTNPAGSPSTSNTPEDMAVTVNGNGDGKTDASADRVPIPVGPTISASAEPRAKSKPGPTPASPPSTQPSTGNGGFSLPIDLGPEPSLSESLTESRATWSRASNVRSGSRGDTGSGSSDTPGPTDTRGWMDRRKRLLKYAGLGFGVLVLTAGAITLAAYGLGGNDHRAGTDTTANAPGRDDPAASTPTGDDPTASASPSGRLPAFALRIRGGGDEQIEPCPDLQHALYRASRSGVEVLISDTVEPIHISKTALLAPDGTIKIRPYPGTQPALTVYLEGEEPFLRQNNGSLILSDLTLLVHYEGNIRSGEERPPVIETGGQLTLNHCTFSEQTSTGSGTRAARSAGGGTEITGCLFRGFDRPLDLLAIMGTSHSIRQSIMAWPRGNSDQRPGWAVRVKTQTSQNFTSPALQIDHCTILGAAGLIEQYRQPSDSPNQMPLKINVSNSAIQADHLLVWTPPEADDDFPAGLDWTGKHNRYAIQKSWVVASTDGLQTPDGMVSPTDLASWTESLGLTGSDDSIVAEVPFDRSALESETLVPSAFAVLDDDGESLGADPDQVGPRGTSTGASTSAPEPPAPARD